MPEVMMLSTILFIGWMMLAPLRADVTLIENKQIVFDGTQALSEQRWNLKDLDPQTPTDWTSYRFLVLEFKASSPQRFQVRLYTPKGASPLYIVPFQNAWVRAVLPLEMFHSAPRRGATLSAVFNNQRAGHFMYHWGPYLPINQIDAISIAMPQPIGKPSLELRSARLMTESPSDAVLEREPLVDEMGQWMRDEWPGKVRTLAELREAWQQEERELKPGDFDYCRYGGYRSTKARATGFFRVEQVDGKWWFVDPDGHLFFSAGADVMTPAMVTPTQNRISIFKALPPADLLERAPDRRGAGSSFHLWNVMRRFGPQWRNGWVDLAVRRMQAWGLNTVANWSSVYLLDAHRMPYVVPLRGWETPQSYFGLPDVYSDEFTQNCDKAAAQQCTPRRDDPFLLGYFIGNEPPWPGREATVIEMILAGPETATRRELQKYLAEGDTPERRKAFLYRAYEKYVEVIGSAIRKYDPNHLNLGLRFGGHAPDEMIRASRVFDVFSINIYDYVPKREDLERAYRLSGRPIVIGEFHFGAPERGMSAGLKQVRNQKERGVGYRYYVENAAAMPALIGTHWFEWVDEPNTGRGDGENYNIGFVDVTDRPYAEMVEAMRATHRRLYAVHSGKQAPVTQKPLVQ